MNAEAIVTVSAVVVTLVQLAKWAGLREVWGPLAVLGLSLLGVAIWVLGSTDWPPERTDIWPIFSGCIAVATSAAGVFGFTRAAVGAVTNAAPPPSGAAMQAIDAGSRPFIFHNGHPALLALREPGPDGDDLRWSHIRRLNNEALPSSTPLVCDTCKTFIGHPEAHGGVWIAESGVTGVPHG